MFIIGGKENKTSWLISCGLHRSSKALSEFSISIDDNQTETKRALKIPKLRKYLDCQDLYRKKPLNRFT